jgi:hypothetical protein
MPLLDHFHPPLSERRHWDSFHGGWAEAMALTLNQGQLPPRYFAEARVKLGRLMEIDVGTLDEEQDGVPGKSGNGVAVWAPPRPAVRATLTAAPPDIFEVQVLDGSAGPRLVAAIELVSPANKDRPAHRRAFAVKCASYLHEEVGLVVVDVVTERHAGLHRELLDLLGVEPADQGPAAADLYAASYRTLPSADALVLESWLDPLALGATLPTLPLWIGPDLCLPLDLEATYAMACAARRIA